MLNYKHLYYFREVASSGSIKKASERLYITPQTISMQISALEESLGVELLKRNGRNLELTDAGRAALTYADEIFSIGAELEEVMQHFPEGRTQLFRVGVSDLVPKPIAYKLLEPAMSLDKQVRIVCTEGKLPDLLAELAVHRMELVIADSPMPTSMNVQGFNHKLGESHLSFFAKRTLCSQLEDVFPQCLDGAPLLVPNEASDVRHQLSRWLHDQKLSPRIIGEFDDSALMRAFGLAGTGIFVAPSVLEDNMLAENDIKLVGRTTDIAESFYAISVERRITHPAVKAITTHAQEWLNQSKK